MTVLQYKLCDKYKSLWAENHSTFSIDYITHLETFRPWLTIYFMSAVVATSVLQCFSGTGSPG